MKNLKRILPLLALAIFIRGQNAFSGSNPFLDNLEPLQKQLDSAEHFPAYSEVRHSKAKQIAAQIADNQAELNRVETETLAQLNSSQSPELSTYKAKMDKAQDDAIGANIKYNYLLQGGQTISQHPREQQISDARELAHNTRVAYEAAKKEYEAKVQAASTPTSSEVAQREQLKLKMDQIAEAKFAYEKASQRARNDSVNPMDYQDTTTTAATGTTTTPTATNTIDPLGGQTKYSASQR